MCGDKDMRDNPKTSGAQSGRTNPEGASKESKVKTPKMSGRKKHGGLIALCLLLPPIGLPIMWAMQRFNMKSRIALSAVSCAILFAVSFMIFSSRAGIPDPTTFAPGAGSVYAPASITAMPTEVPAPTELPYDVVVAPTSGTGAVVNGGEASVTNDPNTFVPAATEAPVENDQSASNAAERSEASGETIVYTNEGSLFYHSTQACGDKQYTTEITLSQALEQGLAPCNNCNAPQKAN